MTSSLGCGVPAMASPTLCTMGRMTMAPTVWLMKVVATSTWGAGARGGGGRREARVWRVDGAAAAAGSGSPGRSDKAADVCYVCGHITRTVLWPPQAPHARSTRRRPAALTMPQNMAATCHRLSPMTRSLMVSASAASRPLLLTASPAGRAGENEGEGEGCTGNEEEWRAPGAAVRYGAGSSASRGGRGQVYHTRGRGVPCMLNNSRRRRLQTAGGGGSHPCTTERIKHKHEMPMCVCVCVCV